MGNLVTARGTDGRVSLSNGATAVLCDLVALAGSAASVTPWEQRLTLHFCDAERLGRGTSGFDLHDLPWTRDHRAEQDFFLRTLDRAAAGYGRDRLHYDPSAVRAPLLDLRSLLAGCMPRSVTGSWMGD